MSSGVVCNSPFSASMNESGIFTGLSWGGFFCSFFCFGIRVLIIAFQESGGNLPSLQRIYCDESRTTQNKYMVFGGVVLKEDGRANVMGEFAKLREDFGWGRAEFKWEKISPANANQFIRYIDRFFDLDRYIYYKAMSVDTSTIRRKYKGKEDIFYTLYYQLLTYSLCKYLPPDNPVHIVLHRRMTKYDLSELRRILNAGIASVNPGCSAALVKQLRHGDSIRYPLIQLVDVLTGAIGYELNGFHLVDRASQGKIDVMRHLLERAGLKTFATTTPRSQHKFSVWPFRFNP